MAERIAKWYGYGLWTKAMVRSAVMKSVITAEEYRAITGEAYPAA